ncbi:LysR family transcriptional regulator [Futiania mangrovi]|uniref:LysR substrate-binding domain-containing protein n=1 Tax=Futiania mangrovi TaxID=2959716 RepID=A0A9J6PAQ4_9PROT|nr:LysR family transcriptional regulator [Futiania mangrovii]MCP1336181.1 LysR substrate-binding domain-containing protein [Futiania mangrovii]
MDRFAALRVFTAVVEEGSFTGAAARLRLAKSAVSKHVQALEAELGAPLLIRSTRQVAVTEVGETYYERTRRILDEIDEADEAVRDLHGSPRGTLKLSAPMSFGLDHLSPALAEFMGRFPDVRVDLALDDRYVDLIEGGFDAAVRIGRLPDSSLRARRIAPARSVLAASPVYLERFGTPQTPDDLAGHRLLHYGLLRAGDVWTLQGPRGAEARIRVRPACLANNGNILRDAAIAGQGIVLQPTFICWQALREGSLVRVLPDWCGPEASIHAVYPPGRALSPKVRAFVDFLADRCGPDPYWDRTDDH